MNIELRNITKNFGENKVLKRVSLSTSSGKALGILGRNGAGKTTSIRILMGVFGADSGEILLDGKPIDRNKISIGYLPEERGLYPKKVILEQLMYFGLLRGMTKKAAMESGDYWLERLQMTEYKNRKLDTLSKGNQQKIQLAVTLVANPDIVILDEPFSGLDPVNAIVLKDIVKELIQNGKLVLFSSHQMNYIEEFCDDILILNGGEVVLSGGIAEIKRSYERNKIIVSSKDILKIEEMIGEDTTIINDTLLIKMKSQNDKERVFSKLTASGYDIDAIEVYEPTLNDIFIEYTGGKI